MGESVGEDVELRLGLSIGGGFMQPGDGKKGGDGFFCGRRNDAEVCGESKEEAEELMEQRRRKELHALRRQAARQKREEKRGAMKARDGKRARGGEETGEGAAAGEGGGIKREGCTPSGFPALPMMQYVVQNGDKVQYIPVAPGCSFPYVVPCWPASSPSPILAPKSDARSDALFLPVPYRSFPSEAAAGASMRPGPPSSSVSGGCRSSAASDSKSGGGSTGESRSQSHSSNPPSQQLRQGSVSSQARSEAVDNADVNPTATQLNGSPAAAENCERVTSDGNEKPRGRPVPAMQEDGEKGRKEPSLPQMPCVSTTGDGPNGKTITGFLYRYTKSEVSIMCVCHGASFSPAEFIKHAGGTDTAHPLRHIIVVPSSAD
ncbi:Ninja-family protein [Nymphaea thermarum]|nr:Ninja-family protein [Nymphaea thermarum]